MPALDLKRLEQRLLAEGVVRGVVNRTITELNDHIADIEQAALDRGVPAAEAAAEALELIGGDSAILAAVRAHPELLTWEQRWPAVARYAHAAVYWAERPLVPVAYCAARGESIARWGASTGLASLLTAALLLTLSQVLVS